MCCQISSPIVGSENPTLLQSPRGTVQSRIMPHVLAQVGSVKRCLSCAGEGAKRILSGDTQAQGQPAESVLPLVHVPHRSHWTSRAIPAPGSDSLWLSRSHDGMQGRELGGAFSSIIHGEISADGAGAFRGWFLMEPDDVSGQ